MIYKEKVINSKKKLKIFEIMNLYKPKFLIPHFSFLIKHCSLNYDISKKILANVKNYSFLCTTINITCY